MHRNMIPTSIYQKEPRNPRESRGTSNAMQQSWQHSEDQDPAVVPVDRRSSYCLRVINLSCVTPAPQNGAIGIACPPIVTSPPLKTSSTPAVRTSSHVRWPDLGVFELTTCVVEAGSQLIVPRPQRSGSIARCVNMISHTGQRGIYVDPIGGRQAVSSFSPQTLPLIHQINRPNNNNNVFHR